MGFFSELDIEVREMIADGATRKQVEDAFPMLREDEVDMYFSEDFDDEEYGDSDDRQPDEAQEWHDFDPDC